MKEKDYIHIIDSIKLSDKELETIHNKIINNDLPKKGFIFTYKNLCYASIAAFFIISLIITSIIMSQGNSKMIQIGNNSSGAQKSNAINTTSDISTTSYNSATSNISATSTPSSSTTQKPGTYPTPSNKDIDVNIPSWYKPHKLIVNTVYTKGSSVLAAYSSSSKRNLLLTSSKVNSSSLANTNTDIALPEGYVVTGCKDGTLIEIDGSKCGHSQCRGVLYSTKTGNIFCITHLFELVTAKSGKKYDNYFLISYDTELTKAVFCGQLSGQTKYVLLDIVNQSMRQLPIQHSIGLSLKVSPDFKYVTYTDETDTVYTASFNIYILDLTDTKANPVLISQINGKSYNAHIEVNISPTGMLVYFKVLNDQERYETGKNAMWIIYNTEIKKSILIKGDIIRFADNDKIVIIESANGAILIDTQTGKEIKDKSRLKSYEYYCANVNEILTGNNSYNTTLSLKPIFNKNEKDRIIAENVSSYLLTDEYAYTYNEGDSFIKVYSLETFEFFKVDISKNFTNAVTRDKKNYDVIFYFSLNSTKSQIMLYYFNAEKEDPSTDSFNMDRILVKFDRCSSMSDLYDLISECSKMKEGPQYLGYEEGKYDTRTCIMYKGDGFNSLIIFNGNITYAIVEDYRDYTFTLYTLSPDNYIYGSFDVCTYNGYDANYTKFRRKLNKSATSEKTLKMFDFISVEPAFIDYKQFYKGDILDHDKIFYNTISSENILSHYSNGYITDVKNNANYGYDIINREAFTEITKTVAKQNFIVFSESDSKRLFPHPIYEKSNSDYYIKCTYYSKRYTNTYTTYYWVTVGISTEGKKYIGCNDRFAYIDDATYNSLINNCKKLF